MKKIISIILIIALVISFSSCKNDSIEDQTTETPELSGEIVNNHSSEIESWLASSNEESSKQETETLSETMTSSVRETTTDVSKPTKLKWQQKYEETLQKCIDDGVLFGAVYVADTDGDGIPTVAVATNPFWFKIPDMILNYVNGNVAIQGQVEEVASGSGVVKEVYFVKGTNDFVFRSIGNTTGTFTANEYQCVYKLSSYGVYEKSQKEFYITEELENEYQAGIAEGNYDITKYQNYIVSEMNKNLNDVYGKPVSLIRFNDVAKTFLIESEEEINSNQQKAVDYINKELGINLVYKP